MIFNLVSFRCLAHEPCTALSWHDRLRGMIGRRFSERMDGMVFPHCGAVHSCFMSFKIDVVFLDSSSTVVGIVKGMKPWCFYAGCRRAVTVVELPEGMIAASDTKIGDRINLNMNTADDKAVPGHRRQDVLVLKNAGTERRMQDR